VKASATRARSFYWLARSRGHADRNGLRILFYHRVSDDPDPLAVSVPSFRGQMELLAGEGYEVVDLARAVALLDAGRPTENVIGLNFDDGFRDVAVNGLPILEGLGFRATVFLPTGVIDGTSTFAWYDEQPPLLTWDEIVELDRAGTFRFEAHTVTHPNLLLLSDEDARREIEGSKLDLEDRLERPVEAFCYPAGLFGERERSLVAEAGFRVAVSCEPGINLRGSDRLALRRRQIDPRDGRLDFRAKVGGGHDTPLPLRGLYRRLRYGERGTSNSRGGGRARRAALG
jgi:peptidoglycan/xylan/chitin deacetylase (PgdA/CDA1 family)